eukprot:gnl/Ergobibamus_cyprinoides/1696.p1 GENE.gnl/Ergobibamus_cyprinoides/1696~~gnl/Ergobibamus_cyprinoides/1696.p1  ORF type:complete len:259 (+),score=71.25 gnl/Ergobibamus_cyprinoides/1696:354-1130(+)
MVTELIELAQTARLRVEADKAARTGKAIPDAQYASIGCKLEPIEPDTELWELYNRYLQTSKGPTHGLNFHAQSMFNVQVDGDDARFAPHKDEADRMLLWHGSGTANYPSILATGLRIAPKGVLIAGAMFGAAIYGADSASKSANYCRCGPGQDGLLMLCEFATGTKKELTRPSPSLTEPMPGSDSTLGVGAMIPNPDNFVKTEDGITIPMGPLVPNAKHGVTQLGQRGAALSLLYNEYMVYSLDRLRIRALIRVRFTR